MLNIDGKNRINLTEDQNMGDIRNPVNNFTRLLKDKSRRQSLRDMLFDSFGLYLGMDISTGGSIQLRYGNTSPQMSFV